MATKVTYIKTSSISRKILQLLMGVALVITTLTIWLDIKSKGEDLLAENAIVLADNILKQTSHSAATYIQNEDFASLNTLTDSALTSDYIYEMLIYDKYGKVISQSENALSTKDRFWSDNRSQATNNQDALDDINSFMPIPYVGEIKADDNTLLGFVRVTVLTKNLQQSGMEYTHTLTKQVILIALLAGFIGYLFTNGLKPFSANAYVVKD